MCTARCSLTSLAWLACLASRAALAAAVLLAIGCAAPPGAAPAPNAAASAAASSSSGASSGASAPPPSPAPFRITAAGAGLPRAATDGRTGVVWAFEQSSPRVGTADIDVRVAFVDPRGEERWHTFIGSSNEDLIRDVALLDGGHSLVAFESFGPITIAGRSFTPTTRLPLDRVKMTLLAELDARGTPVRAEALREEPGSIDEVRLAGAGREAFVAVSHTGKTMFDGSVVYLRDRDGALRAIHTFEREAVESIAIVMTEGKIEAVLLGLRVSGKLSAVCLDRTGALRWRVDLDKTASGTDLGTLRVAPRAGGGAIAIGETEGDVSVDGRSYSRPRLLSPFALFIDGGGRVERFESRLTRGVARVTGVVTALGASPIAAFAVTWPDAGAAQGLPGLGEGQWITELHSGGAPGPSVPVAAPHLPWIAALGQGIAAVSWGRAEGATLAWIAWPPAR